MRIFAGVIALILTSCASTPPATPVEYLLRPPLEEGRGRLEQSAFAALGRVSVPSYLDRQGIVLEMENQRLNVAREHRWAEPLSRSVRRMLQVGISRATGRAVADDPAGSTGHEVIIDVDIHRLHGTVEGRVVLAADWQIRNADTGQVNERHELVRDTLTTESGYGALVQAHVELLNTLSRAIAETLEPRDDG